MIPPIGWLPVKRPDGSRWWVDPTSLGLRPGDPTRLTREQKRRIKAFKERLGPLDRKSLTQTYENISADAHPDREIRAMEAIAEVVARELALRPGASQHEQRLVYGAAVMFSISGPDVDAVISAKPLLKALPHLGRVAAQWIAVATGRVLVEEEDAGGEGPDSDDTPQ